MPLKYHPIFVNGVDSVRIIVMCYCVKKCIWELLNLQNLPFVSRGHFCSCCWLLSNRVFMILEFPVLPNKSIDIKIIENQLNRDQCFYFVQVNKLEKVIFDQHFIKIRRYSFYITTVQSCIIFVETQDLKKILTCTE